MIILTGGAGFIGSVLLQRLNENGITDILIVDSLDSSEKWKNLLGKQFDDYCHKDHFLEYLDEEIDKDDVDAVIHLGACTSTTERNVDYLMSNNYHFSKELAEWSIWAEKPFIYASSAATYGDGAFGFSDENAKINQYRPLNAYGYSKHIFDQWLIENEYDQHCTGFKFFNVFGPNEYHKGAMASLLYKAYNQVRMKGNLELFRSSNTRYEDGEFFRDFVYVKDCVDVLMWSFHNPEIKGIFNLGTGLARSWNDLAGSLFSAMGVEKKIKYVDMPEDIRASYQYFTQADIGKL
ncbi:MAG: ADP-glyceromanno-heptose 6-epimerase, partial [Bacteroidota bacterium]|nr:ADP-glyceromanno-heptose 6-epimerase [Bacteroidota bacterium]